MGLAALAAGLLVAAGFLFPNSGGSRRPTTITQGQILPTATTPARVDPTATPRPPSAAAKPASWEVTYYRGLQPGRTAPDTQTVQDTLDLSIPRAPFNDMPDGNWSLVATSTLALAAGETAFTIEHQGSIRVSIDGKEQASEGASGTLRVVVPSESNRDAALRVEAIDDAGAFRLHWR